MSKVKSKKGLQARKMGHYMFFLIGVACLVNWNSVLTALDYFAIKYPSYNVAFWYPIPMYAATNIFSVLVLKMAKQMTLEMRIYGSLVIMSVLNVALPICAQFIHGNLGFWVQMILIFVLGSANPICQSSAIAYAGIFIRDSYIPSLFAGTGCSGVILAGLRSLCLVIFGNSESAVTTGTLIYFSVASLMQILSIINMEMFKRSAYSQYHLRWAEQRTITRTITDIVGSMVVGGRSKTSSFIKRNQLANSTDSLLSDEQQDNNYQDFQKLPDISQTQVEYNYIISQSNQNNNTIEDNKSTSNKNNETSINNNNNEAIEESKLAEQKQNQGLIFIIAVLRKIWVNFMMVWLNYTICFIVFPGVCMMKRFCGLSDTWNTTLIVFLFNMCDTLGKMATSYNYFNRTSGVVLVVARFLFIPSFISIAIYQSTTIISADWFILTNLILFAFTGGYACSVHFVLAPQAVKTHLEKETASFLMTFPLFFGILSGSLIAISLQNIQPQS